VVKEIGRKERMLKNEKILITGPCSQVGLPVARALAPHNDVYGLARFRRKRDRAAMEALGVKCLSADLATDDFADLPDDFAYVLNFAVVKSGERDFAYDLAANAEGVGRLMAHCRSAKAWLQCSSAGVYQHAGNAPHSEDDPLGDNHRVFMPTYSICKIAAETVVRFACRQWNIPTTIARLSVPYGDNGGWPAFHLEWMIAGESIPLHPEQPNLFNPIHEEDYIRQIPRLLEIAAVPATTVNWGGEQASVEDWCTHIAALTGLHAKFATTEQTIGSIAVDLRRLHELVGPTRVGWREGMRRMVAARHPELLRDEVP
jgi:nucleoside-diphosphate-sugar epimerase